MHCWGYQQKYGKCESKIKIKKTRRVSISVLSTNSAYYSN